jgi:hypothetical protein
MIRLSAAALLVGSLLLVFVSSVSAKPGVVKTRSGQVYEGDVNQRDDGSVVVTIRGSTITIARDDVESIEYTAATFREQFEQRRAKLDPADVRGRLDLARLALEHKEFDLAAQVTDEAIALSPSNQEALTLRETIRQQARLERTREAAPPPAPSPPTPPAGAPGRGEATTTPTTGRAVERRYLSADDIQQIRRLELKPGDGAKVQIPNEVRRAYATKAGLSFAEFNSRGLVEQALDILDHGDESMKRQVKIASDPEAIVRFKQIQPMILTGCATNACHGSANGGGLILFPAESDPATYTNFYILTRYGKQLSDGGGGFFGGSAERKMVERGRGDQSLLAQHGLPESKATYPHPKVKNYRPMFRDREDSNFKRVAAWMNEALKPIEPEYHIDYPIPGASTRTSHPSPTTAPSTTTATTGPSTQRAAATRPATTRPATRRGTTPFGGGGTQL